MRAYLRHMHPACTCDAVDPYYVPAHREWCEYYKSVARDEASRQHEQIERNHEQRTIERI